MDEEPSALSEIRKVAGGVEIEVTFEDGHKEWVKVRDLSPIRDFDRYLDAQKDEVDEVALYCGRDCAWVESLTPESYNQIANIGQERNLPFFRDQYRRLKARSRAINPELVERVERAALEHATKIADSASQN